MAEVASNKRGRSGKQGPAFFDLSRATSVAKGRDRWALAGLTWLAFVLRVAGLDYQSLWRDEVDAIRFASRAAADMLRAFATPGENGPLYYLLLRPWLDAAGRSEFALRFFSLVFGVLAVPLIYRLGRRLFPSLSWVPMLAALLTALSPYLVWYSQEGKMYALVVALVLISMERYLAALRQGGWPRWLAYVLVTSMAFYVHLVAALVLPAQAVVFFLVTKPGGGRRWKPWLLSMAALALPYLPLLVWQLPLLVGGGESGFRFVPLPAMATSLLLSYSLGVMPGSAWWLAAVFVAALLAVGLLLRQRERASLAVLFCWLALPVIGLFLITLARPLFTARYLSFVLPAYLLLLACGVTALAQRSRLLAGLLLLALLASGSWGLWRQAHTPLKADFRAATAYLSSRWSHDDLLLFQIPYGRYSFEYYFHPWPVSRPIGGKYRVFLPLAAGGGELYRWADGLYTNAGMSPAEVDRRMAQITAGSRTVWLVATEVPLWDERGLVQAWLDEHAALTDKAEFVRVTVCRYVFR